MSTEVTVSPVLRTSHPISTSSQRLLDLGATWIHECESSHDICQKTAFDTNKLPTRLLYLDSSRGHCNIRLVTTAHVTVTSRYLTLSYCWGAHNTTSLTKESLSSFHQKIPFDRLSQTIQDSIYLTRQLGFSWLWVDSLCIIQNDSDDWAREAASMADVYSNYFLSIAALGGSNSSDGLFCQRDPLVYSKCKMFQDQSKADVYAHLDGRLGGPSPLERYFRNAPLHKRGWVVQERLLSPRTLNFGVTLIWECRHLMQDEFQRSYKGQYSNFKQNISTLDLGDRPFDVERPLADRDMYLFWNFWTSLVEFYTAASFTIETDRTVALSGAIASVQMKTGWSNTAGLWEPFLLQELLWTTWPPPWFDSNPSSTRVPTWSWFSANGNVRFWCKPDVDVKYLSTAKIVVNDYGLSGSQKSRIEVIHITSNLLRFLDLPRFTGDMTVNADIRLFEDLYNMRFLSQPGAPTSKAVKEQRVLFKSLFFIPISEDGFFWGLAVRKSTRCAGAYERVGVIKVGRDRYDLKSDSWKEDLSLSSKMKSLITKAQRKTVVLV